MNKFIMTTSAIWQQHHKELHAFILSKVKNRMQADDILQEVFVKVHLRLETLHHQKKLQAWLYQIARNSIQDHFRKSKNYIDKTIPELIEKTEEESLSKYIGCLQGFINKLPRRQKTALVETHLKGKSQIALAKKEGITYTALKSRVQAARERLYSLLINCCRKTQTDCETEITCGCAVS